VGTSVRTPQPHLPGGIAIDENDAFAAEISSTGDPGVPVSQDAPTDSDRVVRSVARLWIWILKTPQTLSPFLPDVLAFSRYTMN
jgi:hypothetical protein